MADPISIGASLLAFIGLADRIIRVSVYCIDTLQDAPGDIRMIHNEVLSLRAIVDTFADPGQSSSDGAISILFDKGGPIEACRRSLSGLEALLPVGADDASASSLRRRMTLAELSWPLKQSKARKLLAEISQHKSTMLLAMSGDIVHELRDIKVGLGQLQVDISDAERREICLWLERVNPSALHNVAARKHEPHTSSWLTRSSEWRDWVSASSTDRLLWIHGIPGAGKTVLASYAIEKLKALCDLTDSVACTYYYCHYSHNQDEAGPFLSWTIGQLCRQAAWMPRHLKRLRDRGCEPTIPELEHALELVLERFERAYLVIDAVDESSPRDELVRLVAILSLDNRFRKIRILATSRQYADIGRVFSAISVSISMSNSYVEADIAQLISARFSSSPRLRRWRHSMEEIQRTLTRKANGMFRWVDCQLQSIERLHNMTQLSSALQNLPADLTETYVRIFEAIPEADRELVRRALIWVYGHSSAPWMTERGIHAGLLLEFVANDLYGASPNSERCALDLEYLLDLCGCLVTVQEGGNSSDTTEPGSLQSDDKPPLSETESYVSLAHYTVLEFVVSPHILETRVSYFGMLEATMEIEFATSVLQQAICCQPTGTGTDWVRDREAYCLTLSCALDGERTQFLAGEEQKFLYLQYLSPYGRHYRRLRAILAKMLMSTDQESTYYFLRMIPPKLCVAAEGTQRASAAGALLNLLLVESYHISGFLPSLSRLSPHSTLLDLLNTDVSGSFLAASMTGGVREIPFEGCVWEIAEVNRFESVWLVESIAPWKDICLSRRKKVQGVEEANL